MTRLALSLPASSRASGTSGVRGVRTLRSPRFRMVLACVLLVIGVTAGGQLLIRQASIEGGQFAVDFADFHMAAQRMAEGHSPYAREMLAGPTDAQGLDRYRYPPVFAQLLRPLAQLSLERASLIWLLIQALAVLSAVWIGTGIGGARRSVERALWCAVATVFFLPTFDSLWKGNVSGILALSSVVVALGGTSAGIGAAVGALMKAVPGLLVPATLVMDARARLAVVVTLAVGVGLSFVLAPAAWLDYPTVVRNMLAGSSDYATNLAPASTVDRLGWPTLAVDLVSLAMLGLVVGSVVGSMLLARSAAGLPAAALLGTIALLMLPSSLWYHYLVILLPFAAMAWARAAAVTRVALLLSAAAICIGVAWLPLALLGAIATAILSLRTLWPPRTAATTVELSA